MLIDYYKAIEDSSQKMLMAAQLEDWEEVVRYEGACAVLIEQLRAKAATEMLLPEQQSEKLKIMQRILHNDALILFLAEPSGCAGGLDGAQALLELPHTLH